MSEELSRVKSRRKQNTAEESSGPKSKKKSRLSPASTVAAEAPVAVPGTLSRKSRRLTAPSGKTAAQAEKPAEGESSTPSRTETYPSERLRFSKMFINSLIVIFLLLLAFLLYWGLIGAPDLNELW
ncbi:hypothetical protein [Paenibacillus sp. S150]|uniref:hypothetical protein n=1 Tax=Paenibacillus sp. S150 TaxID=2749826 RepID=UPI001C5A0842|nr:hypothetical protein [Paenibacillus sp. S150]MBW4082862.1 hypothetical protein [Paenibacillus sp. S150]